MDALIQWFDSLGDSINQLVADVQFLVDSMQTYVYVTGGALVFLVFLCFVLLGRVSKVQADVREIRALLEGEKGDYHGERGERD